MKEKTIIEVRNLEKRFPSFHLKDIGFSLPEGYIMGFIGANGAGKTTTIRLLLNLLHKDGGWVRIFGLDPDEEDRRVKERIGVVFDMVYLVLDWRVKEAAAVLKPFYSHWDDRAFAAYCQQFHIALDKKIKDLSRGTQIKLSLAIALSHGAKLLILDEPTSGLDPLAREEILDILQEYIQDGEKSVLFSTHITSDLEKIADYITFIHQGQLLYTGTKDDFTDSFLLVKGDEGQVLGASRGKIIGYRSHVGGFEGLIRKADRQYFDTSFLLESPTIENIMVFVGRGTV